MKPEPTVLEEELNHFDAAVRRDALVRLAASTPAFPAPGTNVNMHCHSFFSYNAQGFSPSRIAWEARKAGLYAAGLCDFDVLDGLDEFLDAGRRLGLRTLVSVETRAFFPELAAADINSPGEPGVTYIMGAGFVRLPPQNTPAAATLAAGRRQAAERNRALVARINAKLPGAAVDYDADVLPLTPSGAATERHIVRAYVDTAAARLGDEGAAALWAQLFRLDAAAVAALMRNRPALEEKVRSALVKKGGLGYEQPTSATFPPVDAFIDWVLACGAVPMVTWLDGTSAGEADPGAMLDCLQAKGAAAVNIVPDRNWNIADPAARAAKTENLRAFVDAADARRMPINIGTELNKDGLPFFDDLDGAALRPYRDTFLRGARILVGHSLLAAYADMPYAHERARAVFGDDRAAMNAFYEAVGGLPALTEKHHAALGGMNREQAHACLREAARRGAWNI